MLTLKCLALFSALFLVIVLTGPEVLEGLSGSANSSSNAAPRGDEPVAQCPDAKESSLPLPSSMSPDEYHDKLLDFLKNTEYAKLKWCVDKGVRDTGPFAKSYLGVHPAVRVYYSPGVMTWLVNGRVNKIPDGAMIVKEMYKPAPAARYQNKSLAPSSGAVTVTDSNVWHDGC